MSLPERWPSSDCNIGRFCLEQLSNPTYVKESAGYLYTDNMYTFSGIYKNGWSPRDQHIGREIARSNMRYSFGKAKRKYLTIVTRRNKMSESFNQLRMPYPIDSIYITRLIRIGDKNSPSESVSHIRLTQLVK